MEYDQDFARQLRELRDREEVRQLKELVPGDWETVHILIGPRTRQWIEREVGQSVPLGDDVFPSEGNLLVFIKKEEVTQIIGTTGRMLGTGVFSSEVTLRGEDGTIKINDPNLPAQG